MARRGITMSKKAIIKSQGERPTTPRPDPLRTGRTIMGERPATPRPAPVAKPTPADPKDR